MRKDNTTNLNKKQQAPYWIKNDDLCVIDGNCWGIRENGLDVNGILMRNYNAGRVEDILRDTPETTQDAN